MTRLYKFLSEDHVGRYSEKRLPISEWIVVEGALKMCANGIHVAPIEHAVQWLDERAHIVEIRGERIVGDDKWCCREVFIHPALPNWNRSTLIQFAADCAERVLPIFESRRPGDDRPRKAIEAARALARGEISADQARSAHAADAAHAVADAYAAYAVADAAHAVADAYAAYAAYAAAYASYAAAYAAAYASHSAYAAAYASYAAAYAAAYASHSAQADAYAAYAASNAYAARKSEREWQQNRLSELLGDAK